MADGGPINRVGAFIQKKRWLGFNPFDLHEFIEWVGDTKGISRGMLLWMMYIGLFWVLSLQIPHLALFTVEWAVGTAPIWLPIGLYYAAVKVWIWYVRSFYLAGQEGVLLEVKMPRDLFKSPRAMELALVPLAISSGETTFISRAWNGGVRPIWSLEIASFGGDVHFYIWCWKGWRNTVESTMYAYYPEIELHEVEDYAQKFKFDPSIHDSYATDWRLETYMSDIIPGANGGGSNENINAYPLKTYIDFELEKDPKEEFKIDPLAGVIEFMGGIGPEYQVWAQIVFKMAWWEGVFKVDNRLLKWKEIVKKEVEKVRKQSLFDDPNPIPGERPGLARVSPTWRHGRTIEAMERNLGKYPFDVGIRGWVVATKTLTANDYMGMRWMWRAFGNPQYSTHLRPRRWHPPFDYPWQDFHNIRWNTAVRRYLDAYRRRLFHHSPWIIPTNVLTNEEIATLWHPVSRTVATPGLERIPAKKVSPPSNLPM